MWGLRCKDPPDTGEVLKILKDQCNLRLKKIRKVDRGAGRKGGCNKERVWDLGREWGL